MKIKCPHCRHVFDVTTTVVGPTRRTEDAIFRRSMIELQRSQASRTIQPLPIDPDRPVSR